MNPYYEDESVTIYHGDCKEILPKLPKVDLVVTSPPYDNLRDYGGYGFDIGILPELLYDSILDGGYCVWVIGDQVVNGGESGNSFRQVLRFMDVGFNLHDTMVFQKNNSSLPDPTRYSQEFEFMFILSRGKPNVFNPIKDRHRKFFGKSYYTKKRDISGMMSKAPRGTNIQDNKRGNVWLYDVGLNKGAADKIAFQHPATFPEKLAADHILSWSNLGDTVLDPFLGSGTTAYCAKKLNRKCIGIEIEEKYCEIAAKRCRQSVMALKV